MFAESLLARGKKSNRRRVVRCSAARRRSGSRRWRFFEQLERRELLTVDWTGLGDATSWSDPNNWSGGAVPGSADDVLIGAALSPTVTIDTVESVLSISSEAGTALSINGGSLTVAANSTLSGSLAMTGGSLTVSGPGVTLTGAGATDIAWANLRAEAGATLSLPNLTSSVNPGGLFEFTTWTAEGAGSTLSLTGLSQSVQMYHGVEALQGGHVDLPALGSFGVGNYAVSFTADGSGSQIDLSALTDGSGVALNVTNTGTILAGLLTNLNDMAVTVDGTGTIDTDQWTALTYSTLTVTGGSYSFPVLSNIDNSSLDVQSGGNLSLPGVTACLSGGTWSAQGVGSTLSLPNLVTLEANWWGGLSWESDVWAAEGGRVNLPALASLGADDGGADFSAWDSGLVDLSALTSFCSGGSLYVEDNGTILAEALTTLDNVTVQLTGTGTIATDQWTSLTNGYLYVWGGSYTLPALSCIDNSDLYVEGGGNLALPAVSSYQCDTSGWEVWHAGSTLSLPGLVGLGTTM